MPRARRPRRRARFDVDARRAQLVRIGQRIFAERPYDEIAIEDVAARAGISKGLLYHYFPTKRDFYAATVRAAADELFALTEPEPGLAPVDQLRGDVDAYLRYVEGQAVTYIALMRGGIGSDPEIAAIVDGARQRVLDRITTAIGIRRLPPALRAAARGWMGFCEAAIVDWLERRDLERSQLVELLTQTFVYALEVGRRLAEDDPKS
jgi:AcrR family transcriptional regulator